MSIISLENQIINYIDFFFCFEIFEKQNVYLVLNFGTV